MSDDCSHETCPKRHEDDDTIYLVIWNENVNQIENIRGFFKDYDMAFAQASRNPSSSNGDVYIIFIENELDQLDDDTYIHDVEHVVGTKLFTCPECKNRQEKYGILKVLRGTKDTCKECGFEFTWE